MQIHLRKRHIETQVYVGAFQYLGWKQLEHDKWRNENINTIKALEYLLTLAKNLLCEIETAINNTGMKVPMILTQEAMFKRLTFRNNNRDRSKSFDIDEIDTKFAKIRFGEYLQNLEQMLKNRMGKMHQKNKQARKTMQLSKKADDGHGVVDTVGIANKNGKVAGTAPRRNRLKYVNNNHNHHHNNSINWPKRQPVHRNDGQMHRNRPGMGKQRRNRKQFQHEVAGLGPNEIRNFRRIHRKSTTTRTKIQSMASRTQNIVTSDIIHS